jgi:hypothetical protein
MRSTTLFFGVSQLATSALATHYALIDTYDPSNFFSKFNFITGDDGTGGFADYQTEDAASTAGLISTGSSSVVFRADNTSSTTREFMSPISSTCPVMLVVLGLRSGPSAMTGHMTVKSVWSPKYFRQSII